MQDNVCMFNSHSFYYYEPPMRDSELIGNVIMGLISHCALIVNISQSADTDNIAQ